ncbi:MAG: hypothetical protein JSU07_10695 [Bacteroidetes bacterium]|nr:hypothetical protein [Bacteroidota bacterium]
MKIFTNVAVIAASALLLISCGDKKQNAEIKAPEGMNVLDLNKYGKHFVLYIPDTSKAKLTISEQSSGALDIKVGTNFAVTINEQAADINAKKAEIKDDEVNKFKSFVTDEPNGILWESEITKPEFHFLYNLKAGAVEYSIEDIRSTDAEPFGKETIQKMYESAKTAVEKHIEKKDV